MSEADVLQKIESPEMCGAVLGTTKFEFDTQEMLVTVACEMSCSNDGCSIKTPRKVKVSAEGGSAMEASVEGVLFQAGRELSRDCMIWNSDPKTAGQPIPQEILLLLSQRSRTQ